MIDQTYNQATRTASDDACLKAMPATRKELCEKTRLAEYTTYSVIARLYPEKCHVIGWQRGERKMFPIYAEGPGVDAPQPKWRSVARAARRRAERAASNPHSIPLVEQAMRQPNSIWAYARQVGA